MMDKTDLNVKEESSKKHDNNSNEEGKEKNERHKEQREGGNGECEKPGQDKNEEPKKPGQDKIEELKKTGQDKSEEPKKPEQDNSARPKKPGQDKIEEPKKPEQDKSEEPKKPGQDKSENQEKPGQDKNANKKETDLILSLVGDGSDVLPHPWNSSTFYAALVEAAVKTGRTRFFCNKKNEYIGKLITQAVNDYVVINQFKKTSTTYSQTAKEKHFKKTNLKIENMNDATLQRLDKEKQRRDEIGTLIPFAIVLMEGEIGVLEYILKAIGEEMHVPVLIVQGSGKAADVITGFIQRGISVQTLVSKHFGLCSNGEGIERTLENIKQLKHMISFISSEEANSQMIVEMLGDLIVRSYAGKIENIPTTPRRKNIIVSEKYTAINSASALPLRFLFKYTEMIREHGGKKQKQDLLLQALLENRNDYVQVFIEDENVRLKRKDLKVLYKDGIDSGHVKKLLPKVTEESQPKDNNVNTYAECLCVSMLRYGRTCQSCFKDGSYIAQPDDKCSTSDLLLWSLFAGRFETARILWRNANHPLLSALISAAILREISKAAQDAQHSELHKKLKTQSRTTEELLMKLGRVEVLKVPYNEFIQLGISLLDQLFEVNPDAAYKIAERDQRVFGLYINPMKFAYENLIYDFLAHICIQRYLNKKWYDELAVDVVPFTKSCFRQFLLSFCLLLPRNMIKKENSEGKIIFACTILAFSAFTLTSIDGTYYNRAVARSWEYWVYIWSFFDFMQEIEKLGLACCRECSSCCGDFRPRRGFLDRAKSYLYDFWNSCTVLSYILLILAIFFRHAVEDFTWARRLYSMSLLVMFMRFLYVFLVNKRLGLTVILLQQMLKDLLKFIVILAVVVFGVGVFYHANLFPNHISIFTVGDMRYWRIWRIFNYPYWQIHGEPFTEEMDGSNPAHCTNNFTEWFNDPSVERCAQYEFLVPLVAGIHMLVAHILLVNIVIAMFSHTFASTKRQSERLWKYYRYKIIIDYVDRVPSPCNIVSPFLKIIQLCKCCSTRTDALEKQTEKTEEYLRDFERIMASRC